MVYIRLVDMACTLILKHFIEENLKEKLLVLTKYRILVHIVHELSQK